MEHKKWNKLIIRTYEGVFKSILIMDCTRRRFNRKNTHFYQEYK